MAERKISRWGKFAASIMSPLIDQYLATTQDRMLIGKRMDSNTTAFLAQELTQIETEVFDEVLPELIGRQICPMYDKYINPGAESYIVTRKVAHGGLKVVADDSNDLPLISLKREPTTWPLRNLGGKVHWSLQSLAASAMGGFQLDTETLQTAREVAERDLDEIIAIGNGTLGFATGLLNDAAALAAKIDATANWLTNTTDPVGTMVKDICRLIEEVRVKSGNKYQATDVILADTLMAKLAEPHTYRGVSALALLKEQYKEVTFTGWWRASTVASGSKARIVAFCKKPRVAAVVVPQEFMFLPPQAKDLGFNVPCFLRTGGCIVNDPLGMRYMEGAGG
jgi:hypothetical protein